MFDFNTFLRDQGCGLGWPANLNFTDGTKAEVKARGVHYVSPNGLLCWVDLNDDGTVDDMVDGEWLTHDSVPAFVSAWHEGVDSCSDK